MTRASCGLGLLLATVAAGALVPPSPAQTTPADETYRQATALGASGDLAAAAEQLRAIVSADPLHIPARRALDVIDDYEAGRVDSESATLVIAGQLLLQRQEWAEAERTLRRAVEQAPEYYQAWHDYGRALSERGQERKAIEAFQKALGLNPDYAYTHNAIALSYAHLGDGERAIEHFQRALEIDPRYYKVYNNLATVLRSYGREKEAQAAYRQALALRPDYALAESNLAWLPPPTRADATGAGNNIAAPADDDTPTSRLVALLPSKRSATRMRAAEQLMARRDPETVPPTIKLLTHRRAEVRSTAARVLGAFSDARALAPLVEAAKTDRDWMVRFEAVGALGRTPGGSATATLVRTLSKDTDFHVRRNAALALCYRRGCATLRSLQAALRDRAAEVRDAAQEALTCSGGRVSSPDPAAWEEWVAAICAGEGEIE